MISLYGILFGMLLFALSLVAIPFMKNRSGKKILFIICLDLIILSFVIYHFSGDKRALSNWFAGGEQHYQLLEKFDALGGLDGAIKKIEARLKANPNDAQGWMILGKLYLTKENYAAAAAAFKKVYELQPENEKAKQYYEMVKKLIKA